MIWLSYLGAEALEYILPFTYFVLSRSAGARLYILFSTSSSLLDTLKMAFHSPRPYWIDPRIRALSGSGNYGMPSGHALGASVVWPLVGRSLGTPGAYTLALTIVFLVSASRVYLGVHFISDVVGAWIIAAGLICGFDWLERQSSNCLHSIPMWWQMVGVVLATLALLAADAIVHSLIAAVPDPKSWARFCGNARDLKNLFHSAGKFFGSAAGLILAEQWAGFEASGPLWKRCLALGYALVGARLLRETATLVATPHDETLRYLSEFVLGAALNIWTLFFAPWILLKMNVLHTAGLRTPAPFDALGCDARQSAGDLGEAHR
jgi:membrane-associated phospholipid phosphatase